jgi:hypothetical protein
MQDRGVTRCAYQVLTCAAALASVDTRMVEHLHRSRNILNRSEGATNARAEWRVVAAVTVDVCT